MTVTPMPARILRCLRHVLLSPLLSGALAVALFGLACGTSHAANPTPQRGGSVVFVIGSDPATANPVLTTSSDVGLIGCVVYQGLTTIGPDGIPSPLLAKSWTISPDGLTYTFELNHAKWHDGKPFTSADVKYSLLEASSKYNAVFSATGRDIAGIDTPADDRVVIRLKHPYGPLLLSLSCTHGGAILPKHVFEGTDITTNKASTTAPIGTGAFKLASWTRGDSFRLVRNPEYWEPGKPYLDEVIGKILPQPGTRVPALLSGQADFITYFYLPASDYDALRANPDYMLTPAPVAPSQDMLFLNTRHKPFDDKRVRQALFIAIDRPFLLKSAFRNVGQIGHSPFGPTTAWYVSKDIDYQKLYPFDPARADKLLDAAGYPKKADGTRFSMRFTYNTDDAEAASVAIVLQKNWKAVGIDLALDPSERTTASKRVFQDGDFDAYLTAYTSYFDPALGLARAWISATIGKPYGNPTGFSTPQLDTAFEQAANLTDQKERAAKYHDIEKILADEMTVQNLRDRLPYDASVRRLHGLEHESHLSTWRNAWIEKP